MRIQTRERILGVFLFSDFENVYKREKIISQKLKNRSNQLSVFFFIKNENKGIFVQNNFS